VIISANTMPYAKRFNLLIRDIYGVDWWKKTESRKSRATVPLIEWVKRCRKILDTTGKRSQLWE
jgi:hypothetical protein